MPRVGLGRPPLPGNENTPKKAPSGLKRKRLTYEQKLRVIKCYEAHGMPETMDRFYPNVVGAARESARKNIHLWVSSKHHIQEQANDPTRSTQRAARSRGVGITLTLDVEDRLVRWICDLRTQGIPVTHAMLREKALEAAQAMGLSHAVFKASETWITGFKHRHGLDRDDPK
ncbi:Aste57867_9651 [Aphanomyces stellatus]|uniref:Aste57867_9651 protein n=1 Tax=Aphanomyces stellatus TaxID=120398 RepID=A0A485KNC9_9STRA|nr:hypothetical protein As57867_009613 [Aphanomyces stellatus]VFT86530.1 Aste57867_9651 [Aphanomyces stellatus]